MKIILPLFKAQGILRGEFAVAKSQAGISVLPFLILHLIFLDGCSTTAGAGVKDKGFTFIVFT